jgi:hypothetical protein
MTAIACLASSSLTSEEVNQTFETMLPAIERIAGYAFRHVPRWRRSELVSDTIAVAFVAFVRLTKHGKAASAFPTALAWFAVRSIRAKRQIGDRQNVRDVLSPVAQQQKRFVVKLLSERSAQADWELADGRRTTPADIAAWRIDFRCWLGRLQKFKRQVALRLVRGDTTSDAARHFGVSHGRISQLRQELRADWDNFQGVFAPG